MKKLFAAVLCGSSLLLATLPAMAQGAVTGITFVIHLDDPSRRGGESPVDALGRYYSTFAGLARIGQIFFGGPPVNDSMCQLSILSPTPGASEPGIATCELAPGEKFDGTFNAELFKRLSARHSGLQFATLDFGCRYDGGSNLLKCGDSPIQMAFGSKAYSGKCQQPAGRAQVVVEVAVNGSGETLARQARTHRIESCARFAAGTNEDTYLFDPRQGIVLLLRGTAATSAAEKTP